MRLDDLEQDLQNPLDPKHSLKTLVNNQPDAVGAVRTRSELKKFLSSTSNLNPKCSIKNVDQSNDKGFQPYPRAVGRLPSLKEIDLIGGVSKPGKTSPKLAQPKPFTTQTSLDPTMPSSSINVAEMYQQMANTGSRQFGSGAFGGSKQMQESIDYRKFQNFDSQISLNKRKSAASNGGRESPRFAANFGGSSIADCQPGNWPSQIGAMNQGSILPPNMAFGAFEQQKPYTSPGSGFQQSVYPLRRTASRQQSMLSHVAIGDSGPGYGSGVSGRRDQKLASKQEQQFSHFQGLPANTNFGDFQSHNLLPPQALDNSQQSSSSKGRAREQGTKYRMGPNQMKTRLALDAKYLDQWEEGRRMRKKPDQMEVLVRYFNEDPKWSMAKKIAIAEEIGMTFHQVSKWNWDYRKKMGIPTARQKKPAK